MSISSPAARAKAERERRARRLVIDARRARRRRDVYRQARRSSRRAQVPASPPESAPLPAPGGTGSLGVRALRARYRLLRRHGFHHAHAVREAAAVSGRTVADVARRVEWDQRMADLEAEAQRGR